MQFSVFQFHRHLIDAVIGGCCELERVDCNLLLCRIGEIRHKPVRIDRLFKFAHLDGRLQDGYVMRRL